MRKCGKFVAVAVLCTFVPVGGAWAAPASDASLPSPTVVVAVDGAIRASAPALASLSATSAPSLQRSIEALRLTPLAPAPQRLKTTVAAAYAQGQASSGGGGLSNGAKAAIWISAVAVASVWGYKTFAVTRGTD